ncbi:MAG: YegS/Rv2252/BmrU family lipid kinase [Clostridiaceae bacterium]|nr:YegS/Rv2252/BmrU family lipid kinase [Clostridiaceae bacterium]
MKNIHIICNPNAGRQIVQKNIPKLVENLKSKGDISIDISHTKGKDDAKNLALQSCGKYDLIVTVGGDGTVNEVVNGVMDHDGPKPRIAIYPAGTINDFGTYLKVPRKVEEFSKMIHSAKIQKVDVGVAGDRYFLNVAAAGLLPEVAHKVSSETKTVLGKFGYYVEGIKEFSKQMFRPIKIKIEIDGIEEEKEILFFLLANSPSVGGFKFIAPEAKIDDGKFDLLIVEHSQFIDVAAIFFKVLSGNHASHPTIKYLQVNQLKVHSDKKIDLDVDGELGGNLPVNFSIVKQALDLIVP